MAIITPDTPITINTTTNISSSQKYYKKITNPISQQNIQHKIQDIGVFVKDDNVISNINVQLIFKKYEEYNDTIKSFNVIYTLNIQNKIGFDTYQIKSKNIEVNSGDIYTIQTYSDIGYVIIDNNKSVVGIFDIQSNILFTSINDLSDTQIDVILYSYIPSRLYNLIINGNQFNITNNITKGKTKSNYITTIGMYNENNQLLVIVRLSNPLQKSTGIGFTIPVKIEI